MEFYINLKGKERKIRSVSEFNFEEYNSLLDIFNITDINEQYKHLWKLFTSLSWDDIAEIDNLYIVDFKKILAQPIRLPIKLINNKAPDINLDNITVGKFIDFEYFINQEGEKIENICALLLLGSNYSDEDFLKSKSMILNEIKIGKALTLFEVYIAFRSKFYKDYAGLFTTIEDEEEEEEDIEVPVGGPEPSFEEEEPIEPTGWGLIEMVYASSGGDYLKVDSILAQPLYSFMNYASWQKEQNDKEQDSIKQKTYSH